MKQVVRDIESGKQRGFSKNTYVNNYSMWCNAAIQKYNRNYRAHVSVIKEENIAQEKYEIYFT